MGWVRDFFEVDVSKIRVDEVEPNWERTPHGYTREQIAQWIAELKEIQRLCREKGYTDEDFRRMRSSADPKERALGETYHKFYDHDVNHDFIKLEWVGDHYEVTNGRHRVWMAKQMGLRHMPAMVSAPDEATLQRLRAEGERIAAGEYPKRGSTPIWERTSQQRQRLERERW
jgi:hypothetical protein